MHAPTEICPGCGIELPAEAGAVHPYMLGSAACWRGYGQLLAAQYSDPARMAFHQIVVDAYAAQHPGGDDRRAVRSVGIHLMTLALFLERDVDPRLGTRLHRLMTARPAFHRLEGPDEVPTGALTHAHVPRDGDVGLARERAYEWGRTVWDSWRSSHEVVRRWIDASNLDRADTPRRVAS